MQRHLVIGQSTQQIEEWIDNTETVKYGAKIHRAVHYWNVQEIGKQHVIDVVHVLPRTKTDTKNQARWLLTKVSTNGGFREWDKAVSQVDREKILDTRFRVYH